MEPWDRDAPTRDMEDEIHRGLPHPVRQHTQNAILSRLVTTGAIAIVD
jgi:hypothetical protein